MVTGENHFIVLSHAVHHYKYNYDTQPIFILNLWLYLKISNGITVVGGQNYIIIAQFSDST